MQSQKILNLLDPKDEDYPKYQTKRWYIINDSNNGQYNEGTQNDKPIKIDTEVVKSLLCDYSDVYILVTSDITVVGGNANTKVVFENYHPFTKSEIYLNDEHVEAADNLDLIINLYNLIEHSDNYSDSAASFYHFKRQEPLADNDNINVDGSSSFKYKSGLLKTLTAYDIVSGNAVWKNAQIIVPLKYISSFFRSLEPPLINTKLYIQLNYTKNSVISTVAGDSTFKITKTELYVPGFTLKIEDNSKLNQLLDSKFRRTMYWNEYKSKIEDLLQVANNTTFKRTLLDTAIPGVNRLFVAGFPNDPTRNSHRKYFFTNNKY